MWLVTSARARRRAVRSTQGEAGRGQPRLPPRLCSRSRCVQCCVSRLAHSAARACALSYDDSLQRAPPAALTPAAMAEDWTSALRGALFGRKQQASPRDFWLSDSRCARHAAFRWCPRLTTSLPAARCATTATSRSRSSCDGTTAESAAASFVLAARPSRWRRRRRVETLCACATSVRARRGVCASCGALLLLSACVRVMYRLGFAAASQMPELTQPSV